MEFQTGIEPGHKVMKLFPCSIQLSVNVSFLINSKVLLSKVVICLSLAKYEIFSAHEYEIYQHRNLHAQLS